ncbi:MAG TPA: hypothetical protein VH916_03010, partial [Dehalococcoidia bacterium]
VALRDRGQAADAAAACHAFQLQATSSLPGADALPDIHTFPVPGAESGALCVVGYGSDADPHIEAVVSAVRGQTVYLLVQNLTLDFAAQHVDLSAQVARSFALTGSSMELHDR